MRFSIIIPVHSARSTLKSCLDAIFSSENKDFEVIVVDDGSSDESALIAKRYPCKLITLEETEGTAFARNIGRDNSQGEILVFIDADVVIKKQTLGLIDKSFREDKDLVAVTGLLSKDCPHQDFYTQYKNLYMHYIFKKCPRYVDFLYGSINVIKKDYFLKFERSFSLTADIELGQRYNKLNKKILLNPELQVIHLKKYNLKKIIKNDFSVPFWYVKPFILYKGYKDIFGKRRFAHARMNQLISISVSYLVAISIFCLQQPGARIIFFISLFLFLALNLKFFAFLYKERGLLFSIKSIIFTYFDLLIMGLGILAGFIYHLVLRNR